ncbi:flagellar operon protein [Mobilisporobacter senegalensis]|uniref:Flagellar operon protein n=1 Tax=Mobilisporobacter senegalensis TaxID=1329262 RepID=A0A3N1XVX6_9FIRM|nr:TIGR02530 family flagellar biosynthesis protein [Mobilisporobacter senegalensis]ROR30769.1 flagellar operon protein [Mobilisporobacter senegalensis]
MNISKNNFPSIEQMTGQLVTNPKNKYVDKPLKADSQSFQSILEKKQEIIDGGELKFSKHANDRLAERNIDLSDSQLERLELGARKASEKGINESLVMIDDLAFIVNVKNNTVVTAVNDSENKIFTNIDGAVII